MKKFLRGGGGGSTKLLKEVFYIFIFSDIDDFNTFALHL